MVIRALEGSTGAACSARGACARCCVDALPPQAPSHKTDAVTTYRARNVPLISAPSTYILRIWRGGEGHANGIQEVYRTPMVLLAQSREVGGEVGLFGGPSG